MNCPRCGGYAYVMVNREEETYIYRRRICHDCGARFTTYEKIVECRPGPKPGTKYKKRGGSE